MTDGETVSVRMAQGGPVVAPPANTAPTGQPAISGTAMVGETLTASTDAIADADGLENATYAYQWLANDGDTDTDIAGATQGTYEVAVLKSFTGLLLLTAVTIALFADGQF